MSQNKGRNSKQKRNLKLRIAKRDGWKCKSCKWPLTMETATLDHIKRLKHGGSWHINNLRLLCYTCNQKREWNY